MNARAVASRSLRALLRAETLWWMTRIHLSNINIWPVVFGAVAARTPLSPERTVELCLFAAFCGGALFIVNDILDADRDRITAPYLPLPSGLLTRRQAWFGAGGFLCLGIVALCLAARTPERIAAAPAVTALTAALSAAYSKVKDEGVLGSLVISVPQTVPVLVAWWLAGGGRPWAVLAVCAYQLTACISNNILAALRDVDLDPVVGNRTLPVRIGAARAFRLAATIATVALAMVLVLGVLVPSGWPALAVGAAAAFLMATTYPRTYRACAAPGRGRLRRMADLRDFKTGEYVRHVALAAVFSLPTALLAGAVMYLMLRVGGRWYTRRLIDGGLLRALVPDPVSAVDTRTGAHVSDLPIPGSGLRGGSYES